jgi:hypothetical protein
MIPIGTLCIVIGAKPECRHLIGKTVTVIEHVEEVGGIYHIIDYPHSIHGCRFAALERYLLPIGPNLNPDAVKTEREVMA